MPRLLAEALVLIGAFLLVLGLIPATSLVAKMSNETLRHGWRAVQWTILAYIVGYSVYIVVFWQRHETWFDVVAPAVLFATAFLVKHLMQLTLHTVDEAGKKASLARDGITDALIGVYNRQYLEHRLSEEVARARRHAVPLAVLLIDIDHFRRVNEKWGRDVGDHVLTYLGQILMAGVRESDVVARFGGEEILVIAPSATVEEGLLLADRLRVAVETENLAFGSGLGSNPELQVTVSIGVAALEPGEDQWQVMVARAEAAVTKAKFAGRNRVAT
jgi:diguanylate cyclase (GGDEF)-like protein